MIRRFDKKEKFGLIRISKICIIYLILISLIQLGFSASATKEFYPTSGIDTSNVSIYILTPTDLQNVRISDNIYYKSIQRWYRHEYNDSIYLEFHFSPDVPSNITIESVKLYFEWRQDDCNNILKARLKIWNKNRNAWEIYDLNTTNTNVDKMEIIDLTNILNTNDQINHSKIQFQAHDYGGGGHSYHDLIKLELRYNCDHLDGWYNTTEKRWVDLDNNTCKEMEQIKQEYRDYEPSDDYCNYNVTDTRWIDTGATRNKPDGTTCDDSLWCTVNDSCQAGVCRGAPRDCSANNLPRIDTCTNNPDNNPFTWDFFAGFISTCDEVNKRCTEGVLNITHTCSKQKCNAECEVNSDCSCPQDYCDGSIYYDYPEHGVCLSNCSCDVRTEGQNAPCKPTIYYNDPRCDRVAPNTTKVVGNPKIEGSGFTWISQKTKITLTCVDNFPNVTLYWAYQVDNGDWNKFSKTCENNNTCIVEFNFTEDSNHTLQYYCVDAAGNSEKVHEQKYRVDSEAPESNKTYGTPFYSSCGKDYINSSTRIRLSAVDKGCMGGVGIDKILYRIDNGSWQEYCCEFTIQQEGEHRICFKAIDKLGNEEQEKCQNVIVDNTPPTTTKIVGDPKCSAQTCGINCETINSSTPITLSASDSSSGLNKTYYRYCSGNESCSGVWNVYTTSFNIVGIPDGYVRIEYYSVDNLGNKEDTKYQIHYLDNTPPITRIITPFNVTKTVTNFTINIEDRDHCIAKCYYQVCNSSWCSDWLERNCNSPITLNLCDYIDSCNLCNNTKVNITLKAYSEDCIGYRSNITSAKYTVELVAYQDGYPFINVYPTTLIPTFV
ncbi:MAG: hypothetical protein QW480_01860, partial [Candidatus Aenigmatarchaeota archaeon]